MNGKASEANAQLEQLLAENPNNAAAHYELARTKMQMGLSNTRELMTDMHEILHTIEEAIKIDPDNVSYNFFEAYVTYMRAYMAFQKDDPDTTEKVAQSCSFYESALTLKPDYHEAMLYLVEIYGLLPEDKGGDRAKAEHYANQLEEKDKIYSAKARAILMPDDADYVGYWKAILKEQEGNADVLVELGRAYLLKGEAEDSAKCYEESLKIDPEQTLLLLDLGRYYGMVGLRDEKKKETMLPLTENMFRRYLETEPIKPLKAFATKGLGTLNVLWVTRKNLRSSLKTPRRSILLFRGLLEFPHYIYSFRLERYHINIDIFSLRSKYFICSRVEADAISLELTSSGAMSRV